MDFACIVLFLALYHLKPQEWTPIFATIHFVQLVMFASIASLFLRERSVKPKDFWRTPHDYAMYAFFIWIVVASPTPMDSFKENFNRLIFYVVIVQTLTNWERITKFLGWWTGFVAATAFLALAGEYFWDPLNSHDLTHGAMRGRLVLALSMVNNPNALAHTLAPAFSMLYYFCIWKRPLVLKQVGLFALALPLFAIYLTESKGGYFVAAAVIAATLTFGRPKSVQIFLLVIMVAGGTTALYTLPRMGELQKSKTDEAIQGRIKAFTFGRDYRQTFLRGVGQGQFIPRLFKDHHYYKASHSTYVQTGAELGNPGLFLFLLVMWCNFRTVIFAKTHNVEQERIRRILFVLLLSYTISGWMVDFAYRPTYFMFSAAVAAFHRHLYKIGLEEDEEERRSSLPSVPAWRLAIRPPVPAVATVAATPVLAGGTDAPPPTSPAPPPPAPTVKARPALPAPDKPEWAVPKTRAPLQPAPFFWQKKEGAPVVIVVPEIEGQEDAAPEEAPRKVWRTLGFLDLIVAAAWTKATIMLWQYAIDHI